MNSLQALHIIKGKNIYIVYNSENMNLAIINENMYNVLEQLKEGHSLQEIARHFNLHEDKIENIIKRLSYPRHQLNTETNLSTQTIERITLHVSNDCNLRCKYCYANGGNYNQTRSMMTLQTAEEFILFCNRTFKDVKTIVFFGGEPLLNLPVMTYICTTFKELHAKGKIQFLPEFGMITNGTMTNNDIIEFINKHLSFVTVSIDGNKELNDANRIFKNGKGSYDKIAQFIHAIQENTTTSIRYEATYTQYHIEKGYTQNKVADIIEKKFGIEGEVIEEMSVQSNCTKDYWNNYTFESWKEKGCSYFPEGFWSIMKALSLKKPKTMCGIARNIFAVSTDGSIYPCHINTGIKGSFLGNIQGKNIFNDMKYRDIHFPVNIEKNETCQTCWANTICGGCSRTWFYQEEKEKFMEHPKETLCKQNKIHLERILLMIAQIKQDRKTWEQLSTRQKI